jgi:ribonucleoside-diphosphate reductase alpha chain
MKDFCLGGDITLFSPHDVPGLYEAFFGDQDKFKELYEKYEKDKIKVKKLFPLWNYFLH